MNNDYWVSRRTDGQWIVKRAMSSRTTSIHNTQEDAWKEGRRLARGAESEAYLKDRNGRIRARNSYGNDPCPPRG